MARNSSIRDNGCRKAYRNRKNAVKTIQGTHENQETEDQETEGNRHEEIEIAQIETGMKQHDDKGIVYIPNNLPVCTRKPRMLIAGKTVNNKRLVIPALDATIVPRDRVQKMPAIAEMTEKWLLEFNTSELVYTSQFQTTLHNNQGITRSMHLPFDQ